MRRAENWTLLNSSISDREYWTFLQNSITNIKIKQLTYNYFAFDFNGVILDTHEVKEQSLIHAYSDPATDLGHIIKNYQRANRGLPRMEKFVYLDQLFFGSTQNKNIKQYPSRKITNHIMAHIQECEFTRGIRFFLDAVKNKIFL